MDASQQDMSASQMGASQMGASQRNVNPTGDMQSVEVQSADMELARAQMAKWWWAWLVIGIIWLIVGLIVLQFREGSAATVGIIFGVLFLAAGVQEFALAFLSSGWRWLWITFGVLLVIGGLYAIFNPVRTFVAMAEILGFLFLLVGILWTIEAFATRPDNELWWLGLIAGIMMIGLGFWAESQYFATRAYTLLVFTGIWAIVHGITDIIKAFQIKRLGSSTLVVGETTVTGPMTAS
jgi:uncharacterized membrane protein HdeD (DUF308 family)